MRALTRRDRVWLPAPLREPPPPPPDRARPAFVFVAPPPIPRFAWRPPVFFPGPRRLGDTDARTALEIVAPVAAARTTQRPVNRGSIFLPGGALAAVGPADERTFPSRVLVAPPPVDRWAWRPPVHLPANDKEPTGATETPTHGPFLVVGPPPPIARWAERRQPTLHRGRIEAPAPPADRTLPASLVIGPYPLARIAWRPPILLGAPRRFGDTDARLTRSLAVRAPELLARWGDRRQPVIAGARREEAAAPEQRMWRPLVVIPPPQPQRAERRQPYRSQPIGDGTTDARTPPLIRLIVAPPPRERWAERRPIILPPPRRRGDTDDRLPPSILMVIASWDRQIARLRRGAWLWPPRQRFPLRPVVVFGTLRADGLTIAPVLSGDMILSSVLSGDLTIAPVLSGDFEVTIMSTIYANDTVRTKVTNLTHDLDGAVTAGEATGTSTVYRADDSILATGSVSYVAALSAWTVTFAVPSLTAEERLRAKTVMIYTADSAQKTFQAEAMPQPTFP